MKKFALAATLAAGVLTVSACSQTQGDNEELVVETKNGNITKEEFYQELKNRHGEQVLQEMVVTEVLNDKYEVTDEEVEKEIQTYKDQYGQRFQQLLQQNGIKDEEELKEMVRISLLKEKAVTENVKVTEEDIKQRYERMQTELEASHILLDDEETAKNVLEMVKKGDKEFAELAKEFSTGPSASQGGQLNYFSAGKMVPEFENAAYQLEVGEISEPVKTQFGWHIIKVTDKRKVEDIKPYEEMKDKIKRELKNKDVDQQKAAEQIDKLIKDAQVDIKIKEFKDLFKQKDDKAAKADKEE